MRGIGLGAAPTILFKINAGGTGVCEPSGARGAVARRQLRALRAGLLAQVAECGQRAGSAAPSHGECSHCFLGSAGRFLWLSDEMALVLFDSELNSR